jgi:hypothetical protein
MKRHKKKASSQKDKLSRAKPTKELEESPDTPTGEDR